MDGICFFAAAIEVLLVYFVLDGILWHDFFCFFNFSKDSKH